MEGNSGKRKRRRRRQRSPQQQSSGGADSSITLSCGIHSKSGRSTVDANSSSGPHSTGDQSGGRSISSSRTGSAFSTTTSSSESLQTESFGNDLSGQEVYRDDIVVSRSHSGGGRGTSSRGRFDQHHAENSAVQRNSFHVPYSTGSRDAKKNKTKNTGSGKNRDENPGTSRGHFRRGRSGNERCKTERFKDSGEIHGIEDHRRKRNLGQLQQASASGSTETENGSNSLDIPGFYYDHEKKKYFKILDSAGNAQSSFVTKESIARKEAEARRQKDLADFKTPSGKSEPSATTGRTKSKQPTQSVLSLLVNREMGTAYGTTLHSAVVHSRVLQLKQSHQTINVVAHLRHAPVEHMTHMEMNKSCTGLLCVWSMKESMMQRLQHVIVKEGRRTKAGELTMSLGFPWALQLVTYRKISSMCWAEVAQFPGRSYVLYTSMCPIGGKQNSLAFLCNLSEEPGAPCGRPGLDFCLGTQAVWKCAWNYNKQQFGVGMEKGCVVIDVNTRRLWDINTNKKDAFALTFSQVDGGNSMYAGTKCGRVLRYDMRTHGSRATICLPHQSSVCCVRLSPEENFLYASDYTGQINKWDLRMKKVVLTYDGLYNVYSKLPFHIDETQSLLYGVGQDCYTNFWCLKTGKLLLSIPPPHEASVETIPCAQFSTRWAGNSSNQGLLMGSLDQFYMYGPEEQ